MKFNRATIRLPDEVYREKHVFHITCCTYNKQQVFIDFRSTHLLVETILETKRRFGVLIHAYCVMPDHVHILAENAGLANMISVVQYLKQKTGFVFRQENERPLWQPRFMIIF